MRVVPVKNIPPPTRAFRALEPLGRGFILSGGTAPGQRRYSYVGAGPFMELWADLKGTYLEGAESGSFDSDPFSVLSEVISGFNESLGRGPFPFNGGGVGYFSYDLKDVIDRRGGPSGRGGRAGPGGGGLGGGCEKTADPNAVPLCSVGFYDPVYVYDHQDRKGFVVSAGTRGSAARTDAVLRLLEETAPGGETPLASERPLAPGGAGGALGGALDGVKANLTKSEYIEAFTRAREYIAAGDIYQINLSQRLTIPWTGDPFDLYRTLLKERPARFSSYLDFTLFKVISNSPERLLKVEGDTIETQPIKGTRPRGATRAEDLALIEELRTNAKERSEHVMIVDLERNDLGRVSVAGSVTVTEFEKIETYPGLHHMVSTIRGRLKPDVDSLTALKSAFPGGSITGAPKIRAMEIIDELEHTPRGIYTGGVGFIDFNGDMDVAMAIRTALLKDSQLHLHVGGGIVADSVAEDEYEETILKAGDFLDAARRDAHKVAS